MIKFISPAKDMISDEKWLICQDEYLISENLKLETDFTLSNGYAGIRGCFEEGSALERPGTYVAGVFDKSEATVRELVNLPSWIPIKLFIDGEYLTLDEMTVIDFQRILDMKKSILFKKVIYHTKKDKKILIESYRFLSKSNLHRSFIKLFIQPLNFNGRIGVENIISGSVNNSKHNPRSKVKHFKIIENTCIDEDGIFLEVATRDDDLRVGIASNMHILGKGLHNRALLRRNMFLGESRAEYSEFEAIEGEFIDINKYITFYTSRDVDKRNVSIMAKREMLNFMAEGYEEELKNHLDVYAKLWSQADIEISGDKEADKALRFNIFHLLSVANPLDDRVSIGAKGLHGEGYKGHVFWDTEVFMLPFYIYEYPEAARALLIYRYNLLNAARKNAEKNGYKGAQYPWESADTGEEETPRWGVGYLGNPVRIWTGDIEHHITADVALAIFEYYRATNDLDFMIKYGIEILLETARFWASRVEYNTTLDRYEINDVIGPDEFHEHINNNFYTNYLAKWNIKIALKLTILLKEKHKSEYLIISSKICLLEDELNKWQEILDKIYLPYDRVNYNSKLMEEFEGYFNKEDFTINKFDENNMPIWPEKVRLNKLNDTQLIKQADIVMLLLLLGEEFDDETKKLNYHYYEKRTMHKSSLSPSMYAIMGMRIGEYNNAYEHFLRSALVDLKDNQGNTSEGLHMASAGGTWQVAILGFGGMHVDEDGILCFDPYLPDKWNSIRFKIHWRGNVLDIHILKDNVAIEVVEEKRKHEEELKIKVKGNILTL